MISFFFDGLIFSFTFRILLLLLFSDGLLFRL